MGSLYPTLSQVIVSYLACLDIFSEMGVLHSIPLCSRGSGANQVEPLDLDKNNNEASVVFTSQPQPIVVATEAPEATSTPRPQSPTASQMNSIQTAHKWPRRLKMTLRPLR